MENRGGDKRQRMEGRKMEGWRDGAVEQWRDGAGRRAERLVDRERDGGNGNGRGMAGEWERNGNGTGDEWEAKGAVPSQASYPRTAREVANGALCSVLCALWICALSVHRGSWAGDVSSALRYLIMLCIYTIMMYIYMYTYMYVQ